MPLLPTVLKDQLQVIIEDVPPTQSELAQAWADAMQSYAAGLVPPSSTISAATAALKTALESALLPVPTGVNPAVPLAFTSFAATLASGMLPPSSPPPSPLVLFSAPTDDASVAATAMSSVIHAWMITGTTSLGTPWS